MPSPKPVIQHTEFAYHGEMKIGRLQDAINVSYCSYLDFMRQKGHDKGFPWLTYFNAVGFIKCELQGSKPPRKKVKKVTTAEDKTKYDVSFMMLSGEKDLKVPVYETCDEVRRKIRNHMRDPMVTQAGLVRDIAKVAYLNGEKKTMNGFLGKKGVNGRQHEWCVLLGICLLREAARPR